MNFFDELANYDKEVHDACNLEFERQQHNIELIASENIVSKAVLLAAGTILTNKYAEGYPAHRYYGGCDCVDVVESIAIERAKKSGVSYIAQPGGSIRDDNVIDTCNKYNMVMAMTKMRLFHH